MFVVGRQLDPSLFACASSNSSGNTAGCTLINCSGVLACARMPASMRVFTTAGEAAQLQGEGPLMVHVVVLAVVLAGDGALVGTGLCVFSVHRSQEWSLREGEGPLFSMSSFSPPEMLTQGWGAGGGVAGWLCACQSSNCNVGLVGVG